MTMAPAATTTTTTATGYLLQRSGVPVAVSLDHDALWRDMMARARAELAAATPTATPAAEDVAVAEEDLTLVAEGKWPEPVSGAPHYFLRVCASGVEFAWQQVKLKRGWSMLRYKDVRQSVVATWNIQSLTLVGAPVAPPPPPPLSRSRQPPPVAAAVSQETPTTVVNPVMAAAAVSSVMRAVESKSAARTQAERNQIRAAQEAKEEALEDMQQTPAFIEGLAGRPNLEEAIQRQRLAAAAPPAASLPAVTAATALRRHHHRHRAGVAPTLQVGGSNAKQRS